MSEVLIYEIETGKPGVDVRLDGETVCGQCLVLKYRFYIGADRLRDGLGKRKSR